MRTRSGLWPQRPAPYHEESMESWLRRLAKANSCEALALAKTLSSEPAEQRLIIGGNPLQAESYRALSAVTGVDARLIYAMSWHRFLPVCRATREETADISIDSESVVPVSNDIRMHGWRIRSTAGAYYCPMCLSEKPFHRLLWSVTGVSACMRHRVLLNDACHRCRTAVSIPMLIDARCGSCGADLRDAPALTLDHDAIGLEAQSTVQAWLFDRPTPSTQQLRLPNESHVALYRVVEGLTRALSLVSAADWHFHGLGEGGTRRARTRQSADAEVRDEDVPSPQLPPSMRLGARIWTPAQGYNAVATAVLMLADWPQKFMEFLSVFAATRAANRGPKWRPTLFLLGRLHTEWIAREWAGASFAFIHAYAGLIKARGEQSHRVRKRE